MIEVNKGEIKLRGEKNMILAEFGVLVQSMLNNPSFSKQSVLDNIGLALMREDLMEDVVTSASFRKGTS